MIRMLILAAVAVVEAAPPTTAPCVVNRTGRFNGTAEQVRLAQGPGTTGSFGVFRAPLAVNTDGAPTSYHPDDFTGVVKAINRIDNGITIRRKDGTKPNVTEQRAVLERWRAAGWRVPDGYRITWGNVIAARGGKPCIFQVGENAGYFGSLTALKNGMPPGQRGECDRDDQVDLRVIPAIALRGAAANPLHGFGARKGDLVVAINPVTHVSVAAIIGDTGDGKRIGEGSVALNMRLLGQSRQPRTYPEALRLDTGRQDMVVAVLPATRSWRVATPFTAASIDERVGAWAQAKGYGSMTALADSILSCSKGL